MGRDTAEEEDEDEDRKMPAEEEEEGEAPLKSENTMVEANERTPKLSLLTSKTAEEESDDDSPAGIAKPSSSDTAPAFKSSDDTPGQLKGPPEKNLLMSNMLKFDTDSKSAPVGNLKTEGDLDEIEDQHPAAQPDAHPMVPFVNVAELEEQPEAAPPAVPPVAVNVPPLAMAAGADAPPFAAAAAAAEPTETKKRKGGGKLKPNAKSNNLGKLAKVDKKGMKSLNFFFGPN